MRGIGRRDVIIGSAAGLMTLFSRTSSMAAAEDVALRVSDLPPLPQDLQSRAIDRPVLYGASVGNEEPRQDEITRAYEILIGSPYGTSAIDVAQYFLAVGAGAYGQQYRSFVREWPVRANPLIYHLFTSTLTTPEGDTTAWCAAFVNWCILRSKATSANQIGASPGHFSTSGKAFNQVDIKKYSTRNASSGSFRCWDNKSAPRRGDIVVFANVGTDADTPKCRGQGHVAFFVRVPRDGWVRVLGGNQSDPGSGGAVTITDMSTSAGSRFMKYVSVR